jgi:hypothetical protein
MDEAALEWLRAHSRLRLDADGRFWHEDAPVQHPRVQAALRRGLGRAPDGRPVLRVGREWCYLRVDDVLWRAQSARCDAAGDALRACVLRLDDDELEPLELAPGCLALGPDGTLYARLRGDWVRLRPAAHAALGRFLEGEPPVLAAAGGRFPVVALPPVEHGPPDDA